MSKVNSLEGVNNICDLVDSLINDEGDRVVILCNAFENAGGVSIEVKEQTRQLLEAGYDVTVVTFNADMDPPKGATLKTLPSSDNFYLEKINWITFPIRPLVMHRVVSLLFDSDIAICHRFPLSAACYVAKRLYGTPYIHWHYHVPDPEDMTGLAPKAWVHIMAYFEERSPFIRGCDVACSISESSRKILYEKGGVDSIVMSNDAEVYRFDDVNPDTEYLLQEYGLDPEQSLSIFVGRVSETKDVKSLVEMFNQVTEEAKDAKLAIIGRPARQEYFEEIKSISGDNVIFTGFVPDDALAGAYEVADLFVTASPREGRNLPPLEAQVHGTPVLGFDVPGVRDVVDDGWLASADDTKEFVALWRRIISNENNPPKVNKDTGTQL